MTSRARTPLTYAEYALLPDDGRRHEVIQGDHYVNPAPSLYHQDVSRRIQFQLYRQIEEPERGLVYNAPVDLQLSDTDIVQPDLVVVLKSRRHILTPQKIKGTPDLVLEILSPSNPSHDTVLKRALYERSGVPEYWVVDPTEHQVERLVLADGRYGPGERAGDALPFGGLPGVTVDLTRVW